ncbi:MAG: transglycosylase SLT domain-containing protein [Chloroflexota bacterium]|nr:transglycosylase SLT domain-containing protein [Chloroflexota bacterium]
MPLSLALLAQLAATCPTAGVVPLDRVAATATVESALQPWIIHDNAVGRTYVLAAEAEAVALIGRLGGDSVDAGVMQINRQNWSRFGLTAATVFDPRANICAGMAVLAEAYARETAVSCLYNSGRPVCPPAYPVHVEAARAALGALPSPVPATSPVDPNAPPSWDVWATADYRDGTSPDATGGDAAPSVAMATITPVGGNP